MILKMILALIIWDVIKLILKIIMGVIDLNGYIAGAEKARKSLKRD